MEQKCHDLTLTFLNNGESVCKEIEFNPDALHEIKSKIDAEDLLTFAAVYGDDEWAMDVSCEGNICDNEHDLFEIIMSFINTGSMYSGVNWLRSE